MLEVANSPKKLHILAAKDTGTAEKNIINKDLGIVDDFGLLAEYNGNGTKDDKIPHILFNIPKSDLRMIFRLRYLDDRTWAAVAINMNHHFPKRRIKYTEDNCRIRHDRYLKEKFGEN